MPTLVLDPIVDAVYDSNTGIWNNTTNPLIADLINNSGLKFDFSSLPSNACIASITLNLTVHTSMAAAKNGALAYLETATPGSDPASGDWDFTSFITESSIVFPKLNANVIMNIDLLSTYNSWKTIYPSSTLAVFLLLFTDMSGFVKWYSQDDATPSKRPTLTIEYEIPTKALRYSGSIDRK